MEHFLLPRRDRAQMVSTASQQGKLIRLMQPLSDVFALIEGDKEAKINSIHCARFFRLRAWPLTLMEKMKGQQEYEGKACCRFSVREEE